MLYRKLFNSVNTLTYHDEGNPERSSLLLGERVTTRAVMLVHCKLMAVEMGVTP
jgi:hypothetical protein